MDRSKAKKEALLAKRKDREMNEDGDKNTEEQK